MSCQSRIEKHTMLRLAPTPNARATGSKPNPRAGSCSVTKPAARMASLFAAVLLLATAVSGANLVDNFTEAQAAITGPNAASTLDGTMLGTERDLETADAATLEVTAGAFVLTTAAKAEARVVWDGNDSDATALDPGGLLPLGLDLTLSAGTPQSGFKLTVADAPLDTELLLEIYAEDDITAGTFHIARGALLLPAISATPTDFFISFGELISLDGTPLDLTGVGAIVLTVRAPAGTVRVTNLETAEPTVVATKTDPNTAAGVLPGGTIDYNVTVTSSGGDAANVSLADTLDSNVTPVAGSLRTSPVALDEAFRTFGHTRLSVGVAAPEGVVIAGTTVLDNDLDPDGDTKATTANSFPSQRGGTVQLFADGSFTYDPPIGFAGVDTFTYDLTLAAGDPAPPATSARGRVTIQVDQVVWFVDEDAAGPGTGTLADPFKDFSQLAGAGGAGDLDQPGHIIFVREENTDGVVSNVSLELEDGQKLLGEGVDLVLGGQVLVAGTPAQAPALQNLSTTIVTLGNDNTIMGLNLRPASAAPTPVAAGDGRVLPPTAAIGGNGAGGTTVIDQVAITLAGAANGIALTGQSGSLTVRNTSIATGLGSTTGIGMVISGGSANIDSTQGNSIGQTGGGLVHVVAGYSGSANFTGTALSLAAGTADAIFLDSNPAGSITFGAIGGLSTTAAGGMVIAGSGSVTIGSVGAINATGGPAVDISGTTIIDANNDADNQLTFASLNSANAPAAGVRLAGVAPTLRVAGATTVNDPLGDGISLSGSNGPITFTSLAVDDTGGRGVVISGNSNPVTISGGSIGETVGSPTTTAGNAVEITGGSANITIAATLTNTAARSVQVTARTAGTVHLSGAIADTGTPGVRLASNTAGSVNFSGTTTVTNSTGPAVTLDSNSGGSFSFADLEVTNTASNQPALLSLGSNSAATLSSTTGSLDSGSGTTVDLDNIDLAVVLASVTSDNASANEGINLDTTTGSFSVVGDGVNASVGGNGSGGSISNKSVSGVILNNAAGVTLRRMFINNNGTHGVDATSVNGLTLANVTINDNGNAVAEQGFRGRELTGAVSILDSSLNRNAEDQIEIVNTAGTMASFTATGNTITHAVGAAAPANNGINFAARGTAIVNALLVSGNTFQNLFATGIQVDSEGTIGVAPGMNVISGNTFTGNNIAINLTKNFGGSHRFAIMNNLGINGHAGNVINIFSAPSSSGGTFSGTISGNTIGTAGAGSGSTFGSGIRILIEGQTDATMLVSGNTIGGIPFGRGIEATARNGAGGPTAGLDVTITGNDARADTTLGLAGILVLADNVASPNILRANISGNTAEGGLFFFGFGGDITMNETAGSTLELVGSAADCVTQVTNTNTPLTPAVNNTPVGSCTIIAGPINTP